MIDFGKGMVLFPLADFDAMRESAKKLKQEVHEDKVELAEAKRILEEAASQLEIFMSYLHSIAPQPFQKAKDQFNDQSEEAEIIVRPDGKVKIKILSKESPEKEESSDS